MHTYHQYMCAFYGSYFHPQLSNHFHYIIHVVSVCGVRGAGVCFCSCVCIHVCIFGQYKYLHWTWMKWKLVWYITHNNNDNDDDDDDEWWQQQQQHQQSPIREHEEREKDPTRDHQNMKICYCFFTRMRYSMLFHIIICLHTFVWSFIFNCWYFILLTTSVSVWFKLEFVCFFHFVSLCNKRER